MHAATTLLAASMLAWPSIVCGQVHVDRVDFKGWSGCYRLSNPTCELVFVPQVGRIMSLSRKGGSNFLWVNPKTAGQTVDLATTKGDWVNFGGDKLWNAPQPRWNWPPDPAIDAGGCEVLIVGSKLVVTGKPSAKHGVRFIREIELDPKLAKVRLKNIIENTSREVQEWGVWQVCQVIPPDWVELPASESGAQPQGYFPFTGNEPDPAFVARVGNRVQLRRNPAKSAKVGSDSRAGWAAAVVGAERLVLKIDRVPQGEFPHFGSVQEAYTNPDPDAYIELEVAGPIQQLKPGAKWTYVTHLLIEQAKR